ncbi:hypothetical protein ACP275_07G014400 [Erythranthe tilingii]
MKFFSYLVFIFLSFNNSFINSAPLKNGFYRKTCPSAEAIVKDAVNRAYVRDSGIAAALIRLHFHDCFVRGCDASILLDSKSGQKSEKESPMNKGVQGFEVIDDAKAQIEAQCPNTVSCADIIAFAARDSVSKAGGIYYSTPGGRRDGKISLIDDPPKNLPGEFFNVTQLKLNFARKGLSVAEMVTLSGAHSIGDSHCSSFSKRLYSFSGAHAQDPSLDPTYANDLKGQCPKSTNGSDLIVPFDPTTPTKLDNNYYKNLKVNKGLLTSDQVLWGSPTTRSMVKSNANHPRNWSMKFAKAMVHMGSIDVLIGEQGEIRKNCRVVN